MIETECPECKYPMEITHHSPSGIICTRINRCINLNCDYIKFLDVSLGCYATK